MIPKKSLLSLLLVIGITGSLYPDPTLDHTSALSDQGLDEDENDLPDLVPARPLSDITEPVHAKIKDVTYAQYLSAVFGGEDSGYEDTKASSGYIALHNGIISSALPNAQEPEKNAFLRKMHDRSLAEQLFAHEKSAWRSTIIRNRFESTLKGYLEDQFLLHLLGTHSIPYKEISSMDFYILQTQKAVVVINDDRTPLQRTEIDYLARLIPGAAQRAAHVHSQKGGTFRITPEDLYGALEQESAEINNKKGVAFGRQLFETYLATVPSLEGELKQGKNHNELHVNGTRVYSLTYGPSPSAFPDGSWLSATEIKELAEAITKNSILPHYPADQVSAVALENIHFLEYTSRHPLEERISNNLELSWLRTELEKKPQKFQALFLISFEKQWTSCVITKMHDKVTFTVIDPHNKDRQYEEAITALVDTVQEALQIAKKLAPEKKKDDFIKDLLGEKEETSTDTTAATKKNSVNYDAPLVNLRDDEIPSLEDLFGGKIPNEVAICIKQMKREAAPRSAGTKLKNCLLLYGPPGTGKSTIAQVMARAAGRKIVYAGGGDFRDAYQGSGKAKLDALFAEALKLGNCIILIDEIDGTSSRLQPHGSTQEDNRALKSFITTLDQYRHDPRIFVICTTNYPENIDPAVMRRCKTIEIPLPDYAKRKKIINYYLHQNGIEVVSRTPHALSPDFYDKILSATEGFSGDDIGEMINNAVYEYQEGLKPEYRLGVDFRFQGIDLYNKSILANLGELALLPLTPVFMVIGESDLDKHVYSAYMRRIKLRKDLKENERKNDPTDKYAKDPFMTRFYNRNYDNAGTAIERGFWDILVRHGWKKVFRAMKINILD